MKLRLLRVLKGRKTSEESKPDSMSQPCGSRRVADRFIDQDLYQAKPYKTPLG